MANNQNSSLFKLYVDVLVEQKSKNNINSTPYNSIYKFFEMLANNVKENETDIDIEL